MRVVIVNETGTGLEGMRQEVLGHGLLCEAGDCVSAADLPLRLTQVAADLLLVGAGPDSNRSLGVVRRVCQQTTKPVLVAGPTAEPALVVEVLRSGAREYIDQQQLPRELAQALDKLRASGAVDSRTGRCIAVISANAGSGVTTVASALAFSLAASHANQVLLAEVGSGVPELAMDLDLKLAYGLAELLRDRERMDAAMIRQAAAIHPAGAHILAYTPETLLPTPVDAATMRRLVTLFRSMYDLTVLDLGHGLTAAAQEAVRLAEQVVVVVRLDVPSLRLGRRFCRQLTKDGLEGEKLHLLGNRYNQRGLVSWRQAGEVLGFPVQSWVPDDSGAINRAVCDGKPLVQAARRASITTSFGKLAKALNGRPAKQPRES